ncbi:MAG: hypothetical protein QUS35_02180 [bacterium]|nr:hypothetical protein [bacterium]
MRRVFRFLPLWLLLALSAACVTAVQRKLDKDRAVHFVDTRPVFLPNGRLLRWMSMGHAASFADALWIQSVLYFGRRVMDDENPYYMYALRQGMLERELEAVKRPEVRLPVNPGMEALQSHLYFGFRERGMVGDVYPLLDRVTTLDPHFIDPYIFGGVYVLMSTGELDAAESLLLKGHRENPGSWKLAFYLGWYYWMYRADLDKSRSYMERAVAVPGCPDYVFTLLRGVTRQADAWDLTIQYLRGILESTDNPEIRKKIQKELDALEAARK